MQLPGWMQQLCTHYLSNAARMFVLYFNIDDYVIAPAGNDSRVTRLVPFLEHYARTGEFGGQSFGAIFRYSHSGGLTADDTADLDEGPLGSVVGGALVGAAIGGSVGGVAGDRAAEGALAGAALGAGAAALHNSRSAGAGAALFRDHSRHVGVLHEPQHVLRGLESILRSVEQRSLVIVEHADRLAPRHYPDPDQRLNSEILTRWATDFALRNTQNLCILLARDLQDIDPAIYAPGTGCFAIRVAMPGAKEQLAFVELMEAQRKHEQEYELIYGRRNAAALTPGLISGLADIAPHVGQAPGSSAAEPDRHVQLRLFTQATQGLRLVEIDQLNRQVRAEHALAGSDPAPSDGVALPERAQIRLVDVKRHKRRAIEEQSNGLLEIIDTQRGFAAIGGMEIVKSYLQRLSTRMLHGGHRHLIPRGLILAGPPGTGKTIIAEALALESKLNMVKLRNVREGLVGASERNLTRALEVIKVLAPILVFVDEIDQAFGSRGLGQSSDGGTSERIFGQILEFIGDDRNRGEVIWVAATNRPDVLDAALLRRFDRIIPCLLPTPQEQAKILAALPRSIPTLVYAPELRDRVELGDPTIIGLLGGRPDLIPTGAVIETILRRAAEYAGDRARQGDSTALVTFEDLCVAINDYRSNADQTMYDYQALLAVQACNFYSVMPELPARQPFSGLIDQRTAPFALVNDDEGAIPPCWREQWINGVKLEEQIRHYRRQLGLARLEEGGMV